MTLDKVYAALPLNAGQPETRLLRLDPNNGDLDDIVSCTLQKTLLQEAPEYEALSYCWGDPTSSKTILVNGCQLRITANLEAGLRQLRRADEPRTIWVDYICINQNDTAERSFQVSIMNQIYLAAVRTVSWLGVGAEQGEQAIDFLHWYAGRKALMHPSDVDGRHAEYEADGWAAVVALMNRPYWQRLWVMQEIALSRGQPRVQCGKRYVSWNILVDALAKDASAYYFMRLNRVRGATRERMRRISQQTQNGPTRSGGHVIFLLSHSTGFEVTEPRDRVYALYGLLKSCDIVDFEPDYSKTVAEVYAQITEFALQAKGGLDILELRPSEQDAELASWVVDLSRPPPASYPMPKSCPWQRSRGLPATTLGLKIEHAAMRLTIPGTVVDTVISVHPIPTCLATAFLRAAEEPNASTFAGESLRTSQVAASRYWQSLARADHPRMLCKRTIEYLAQFQAVINHFCNAKDQISWLPRPFDWKQMLATALNCDDRRISSTAEKDPLDRHLLSLKPLLCSLSLMLQGRVCFTTQQGYLGVALAEIEAGDSVIAFQSTKHMHVLRQTDAGHRYVSAAILVTSGMPSHIKPTTALPQLLSNIRASEVEETEFHIH